MISFESDKDQRKQFKEMTKELDDYILELYDKIDKDHNANAKMKNMDFSRYPFNADDEYHFYIENYGNEVVDLEMFVEVFKKIDYVELITRITTQPLDDATGDEETALNSVYQLFPITRDILKSKGRNAENFTKIAVIVLNQIIRPFTAKWHKKKLSGEFSNENECIQFRTELKQLQADLICYSRLLADMAKVEDLTCLLEEDE